MAYYILPTLYLFDNVFFPNTIIPLIITDSPSRNLVTSCFNEDLPLALWFQGSNSKPVATMGKIISIEEKKDGSLKVMLRGIKRVYLEKIVQQIPFPVFHATPYLDHETGAIQNFARLEKFHHILNEWLIQHVPSSKDRQDFLNELNTPHKLLDHLALLLIKDSEIKQIILESTSLQERFQLLDTLIKSPFEKEDLMTSMAMKEFERMDKVSGIKN